MIMPRIFIISGPSGAGKTTLLKRLFAKKYIKDNYLLAISCTTRIKRKGEGAGDYFFMDKGEFLSLKKKNYFMETQKVLDNYYGTPKSFLIQACEENKDLILCIDVKGGKYLKNKHKKGKIITIFVKAPDAGELFVRLKKRKEAEKNINARIDLAKKELLSAGLYDYIIVNRKIEESVRNIEAILRAERIKV